MKNSHIVNFLEKVRADFAITKYAITGFDFVLDNPDEDAPEEVLPYEEAMPRVDGFYLLHDGKTYGEVAYIETDVIEEQKRIENV